MRTRIDSPPRLPNVGQDNAMLLRELDAMLRSVKGRARLIGALERIGPWLLDRPECLRVLILNTMPYQAYLRTLHWREVAKAAKERAGGRCQLCNDTDRLETHHRTYERRGFEEDWDLTVLCDRCHEKFHREPPADPNDEPRVTMTEEQEYKWLLDMIASKRKEQGIPNQDYPTPTKSGTS